MENDYSIKVKVANKDIATYSNHRSFDTFIITLEDTPRALKKALKDVKKEIKKKSYYYPYKDSFSFLEHVFEKMRLSEPKVNLYSPYKQVNYSPGYAIDVKRSVENALLDKQISFVYRDAKGRETLRLVTPIAIYEKHFVGKSGDNYRNYKFEKVRYFWLNSGNKSPLALYKLKNDAKEVTSTSSNLTYSIEKVDSLFLKTAVDHSSEADAYFLSDDLLAGENNYDDLFFDSNPKDSKYRTDYLSRSMAKATKRANAASEAYEEIRWDYAALEKEYKTYEKDLKKYYLGNDEFWD